MAYARIRIMLWISIFPHKAIFLLLYTTLHLHADSSALVHDFRSGKKQQKGKEMLFLMLVTDKCHLKFAAYTHARFFFFWFAFYVMLALQCF